ncbi:glycosyltransferase family 2 protein [Acinetobacter sp. 194]|uniref:glycosyltransferase family A protein n=1 Tax=Acinetobacter shaoyimingii TaxID=2715164 RepID=UPI00140BA626|nr:glycosyltransferase family A protein [Acinetobacter shaoyimingii]NHB58719.1 glycosyltransferase family 2 protein [Acinetobacter shaoyimingii]
MDHSLNFLKKINVESFFPKKYTFCTLVTNYQEYIEMIKSAKNSGFDSDDVEFIYFDNIVNNSYDGFNGINRAIREASGEYLIFCHQDVLFKYDGRDQLDKCLSELEIFDKRWGVAGNAGKNHTGQSKIRITDPNWENLKIGNFPEKVMGVDENFIVINRKYSFGCTTIMSGFHFYGIDLCQNAAIQGLSTYVIDFHLMHKSGGNLNESFYEARSSYIELQKNRKSSQIIWTICTKFFVSNNRFLNWIFGFDYFLNKKIKCDRLSK